MSQIVSEQQPPRSPRPGGPRRPAGSRARAGGSARPVPPRSARPLSRPGEQPTRPLPRQQQAGYDPTPHSGGSVPPPTQQPYGAPVDPVPPPQRSPAPYCRPSRGRRRPPRALRLGATLLVLVLVVLVGWAGGLTLWANSRIEHVDALSGAANTPGTTYLIAGSDQRDAAVGPDGTEGARTDTIMLLHKARNGRSYLISLPRDTLVDIPGYGGYKLNAAYAFGGAPLLVQTVEGFTGLTIDHYVEIGFDGVQQLVDAVGHVNLCIDQDVSDEKSGLEMTKGCHDVGGEQALAFVRARYFDPAADLGRQQRQQQFVSAFMDRVTSPSVLLNPITQVRLAGAGSGALTTSEGTGIVDVGRMALTARRAMGAEPVTLPIADPQYQTKHSGVAVKVDEQEAAAFFEAVAEGTAEPEPTDG